MKEVFIFMLQCFGVCVLISAVALAYMYYKAEPFPYDDEDW